MPFDLSKLDTSHLTHLTLVGDHAIHIEHIEHYHAPNGQSAAASAEAPAPITPDVLNTPEAQSVWAKAQERGWVDDQHQLLISQKRGAILGSVISDKLHLNPRWSALEQCWGLANMSNSLSKAQLCSYYADFLREVETALE